MQMSIFLPSQSLEWLCIYSKNVIMFQTMLKTFCFKTDKHHNQFMSHIKGKITDIQWKNMS
jgi:hypothetical protein